jgi:hypothetical protein
MSFTIANDPATVWEAQLEAEHRKSLEQAC